jgi:hypothetical protein
MDKTHLQSVRDFDDARNQLVYLLLSNNENSSLLIDLSKFKKFELLMMDLRRAIENLGMEDCDVP